MVRVSAGRGTGGGADGANGAAAGTGAGARAADRQITLLVRAGCHLCADARAAVIRVAADTGAGWTEVDVDTSAELADAYGDRVPVVLVDGREHGYWRVEEARLRRALTVGRWGWSRK
ncbi:MULTISPECIES: glutaredoxin family protein [Frankiaceae]|uniref:Glutaredoxin 2 n=1 Tax=Candidatus Protofrankia datiscae TaxID=2716812 RepID=F8AW99_9ACTN|nr:MULTISPECIES: glutaredoxin family protein [Protofrankia]AEH11324.1 glutaredoxin 2 [Candidatus Protofrankia datiscae]